MSFVFRPPWLSPWQRPPLFPWTSSAATNADTSGASSLTFAAAGAGAAISDRAGASTITFGAAGVGSGVSDAVGQTTITFTASGDANLSGDGAGVSSITFAVDGTGSALVGGAGAATITFSASGVGEGIAGGDGAGSCSMTFTVTGEGSSTTTTLTTDLEAIYRLDGDLTDSSGSGDDLTATSALTFGTGLIGQCLDDGSASLASFSGMATLAASDPFTLVGWFKSPDLAVGNRGVIRLTAGLKTASLWMFSDGTNHGIIFYKGNATPQQFIGDANPDDWHFGAISFPGSGAATCYFGDSGSLQIGSLSNDGWPGGATDLVIGTTTDLTSSLDLVSVYSRALSAAEITELWNSGAGLDPTASAVTIFNRVVFTGSVCTRRVFEG